MGAGCVAGVVLIDQGVAAWPRFMNGDTPTRTLGGLGAQLVIPGLSPAEAEYGYALFGAITPVGLEAYGSRLLLGGAGQRLITFGRDADSFLAAESLSVRTVVEPSRQLGCVTCREIGPLERALDGYVARTGDVRTAGVASTDVARLEGRTFEMGSPRVRSADGVDATAGPIRSPYQNPFTGHMEEEFGNQFIKALKDAGYRADDNGIYSAVRGGGSNILMNNPAGACTTCTVGMINPSTKVGVIKQLSDLVPNVTFTFETVNGGAPALVVRGGRIVGR